MTDLGCAFKASRSLLCANFRSFPPPFHLAQNFSFVQIPSQDPRRVPTQLRKLRSHVFEKTVVRHSKTSTPPTFQLQRSISLSPNPIPNTSSPAFQSHPISSQTISHPSKQLQYHCHYCNHRRRLPKSKSKSMPAHPRLRWNYVHRLTRLTSIHIISYHIVTYHLIIITITINMTRIHISVRK